MAHARVRGLPEQGQSCFTALEATFNQRHLMDAASVPEMEPLVQPANNGGNGTEDKQAFGEHAQTFAAACALSGDGDAAMTRGWGCQLHGRYHVHVCQTALALNAWSRGDETFQAMNLTVQFIRTLGQAA
jgi:hypothetical protein